MSRRAGAPEKVRCSCMGAAVIHPMFRPPRRQISQVAFFFGPGVILVGHGFFVGRGIAWEVRHRVFSGGALASREILVGRGAPSSTNEVSRAVIESTDGP